MGRGIKLFKVLGIQVSIDYTWFIVFILFAWTLAYGYFPYSNPGFERTTYLALGVVGSLALFACVLAHELSHSVTSNRLGHEIKEITLFIFGGVAKLTKEPDNPTDELKVAAAGPIASAILAGAFWGLSKVVTPEVQPVLSALFSFLGLINLVLLIFNMIPGFPLDGGRVLRAIIWARTESLDKATRVTSQIGKGFALILIITGLMRIFAGNFVGGIWSVLIGLFLQQAADSGYRQMLMQKSLEGLKVRDLMSPNAVTINEGMSLSEAVDKFFKHHFVSFPVLSGGRLTGILTLNNVRSVPRDEWETTRVEEVMHKLEPPEILHPDEDATDLLQKMAGDELGRYPVEKDGRVVGMVTRRDVMKMLQFRSELRGE